MMDLLEAKDKINRRYLDSFTIAIHFGGKVLTLAGFFSKTGPSIYANLPSLHLTAGSQAKIEEEAKIKALARVIHLFEIKMTESDLVPEDKDVREFKDHLQKINKRDGAEAGSRQIPVFNEILERTENGFQLIMKRGGFVTNLKKIQSLAQTEEEGEQEVSAVKPGPGEAHTFEEIFEMTMG